MVKKCGRVISGYWQVHRYLTPSHRPREGRSPVQGHLNSPSRPLGPDGGPLSPKVSVVSVQSSPSPSSRTARRRQKKARKKRKAQKKDLYLRGLFSLLGWERPPQEKEEPEFFEDDSHVSDTSIAR